MKATFRYCPRCGDALGARAEGGLDRIACVREGCGFIHYDNPVPVVSAIVQRGDDVVLVRGVNFPEKFFALVAGFLERGESPDEGVLREVKEEIGVDARIVSLVGVYPFAMQNQVIIAYHVEIPSDAEVTLDPVELAAWKLIPIAKLRPWPLGTGLAVQDFLARRKG